MAANSNRVANFSAGPSTLPLAVLEEVQKNLLDYQGHGMSVMEMSHRSQMFQKIWDDAMSDIRTLLKLPDNYEVMLLQGGATLQFSAVPFNLNLGASDGAAEFVVTGNWSKKAYEEAKRLFGADKARVVWSGMGNDSNSAQGVRVPNFESECKFDANAAFVHVCINETVHGVCMDVNGKNLNYLLDKCNKNGVPVVADFSSCFMSEAVDNIDKFDVIVAGAQKNVGPAGVTVVIVKKELVGKADPKTPVYLDYKTHKGGKMYNTPPCFSIYVMGLVLKWLKNLGGNGSDLNGIAAINDTKSKLVYDAIEGSNGFYECPVEKSSRSKMNIRFFCKNGKDLDAAFIKEAAESGLMNLKGYRTLGGIRASCYNAMTLENVQKLVKFMNEFRAKYSNQQSKL